ILVDGRVAKLLEQLDEILGSLVDAVGPHTDVLLLSDHGFRRYQHVFNLDSWLLEESLAALVPEPASRPPRAATTLAEGVPRDHERRIAEFDMTRTRAFPVASEGNFGGVRLNLAGREPAGIVAPADAERVLDEIRARLEAIRTPQGEPLVRRVQRAAELYPGPHSELLPDLLFELHPAYNVLTITRGEVFLDVESVNHERTGILAGAGPGIARLEERARFSIFDVAPTALHLLGLPIYDDVHGRLLREILAEPSPPRRVSEADDPPDSPRFLRFLREDPGLSPEEALELRMRLRALGYVE
ncbi:MAG: alkaline phosphatase family protein, partial [Deltaproteobacteria bacterium]